MTTAKPFLFRQPLRALSLSGLVASAVLIAFGLTGAPQVTSFSEASVSPTATSPAPAPRFRSIEEIRVGDRVTTDLPAEIQSGDLLPEGYTEVDPASWRLVRMRAEQTWPDGTVDDINIETLQPLSWIDANNAWTGSHATIPLDLQEMGLPTDLKAKVLSISPCPVIASGKGRVVLTTVDHLNSAVVELTLQCGDSTEVLRTTAFHKFYSASRKEWIDACELRKGETLHGRSSEVEVVSVASVPDTRRVYNVTVEHEHVYRVSISGVLVHNTCDPKDVAGIRRRGKYDTTVDSLEEAKELVQTAIPDAVQLPDAVPGQPYPRPDGAKKWWQIHPAEPPKNPDPHIKYGDWSEGKKRSGGKWGHIYFPKESGNSLNSGASNTPGIFRDGGYNTSARSGGLPRMPVPSLWQ